MPVNFKPREQGTLANLLEALRSGLDPEIGYSLFSGVQGDALARADAARAAQEAKQAGRRDTLSGLIDALIAQASGGMPQTGASALAAALGNAPGVGPGMERRMGATLSDLYPSVTTPGAYSGAANPELLKDPGLGGLTQATTAPSEFSPLYQQPGGSPLDQLTTAAGAASAAGTLAPFLSPETLESLLGPALGGMAPELAGGISGALEAAGRPVVDNEVSTGVMEDTIRGITQTDTLGRPLGLHEVTMAIITPLRAQGYSEADLARLRALIEQVWAANGGPARPGEIQTTPTAQPSSPIGGRFGSAPSYSP